VSSATPSQGSAHPRSPGAVSPEAEERGQARSEMAMGQAALQAGRWEEARSAFVGVVELGEDSAALEGLSRALWWLGEHEQAHRVAKRAYLCHRRAGENRPAARIALWLAREYSVFYGPAARQGWVARAETLLEGVGECPEAGWLALQRLGGSADEELESARCALDLARRHEDRDLEAVALGQLGMALVLTGRVAEGMARLDESMAAVSAGEVEDFVAAGLAFCTMLGACERTLDFGRAEQWSRAAEEFSRRNHDVPLFALCRTFYGDVLIALGRWEEADELLRSALAAFAELAPAWRRLGLLRLAKLRCRQGRIEEAARLIDGLEEDPECAPVLADIHLTRGEPALAASWLERALDGGHLEGLSQVPLLVKLVDARIAGDDLEGARRAGSVLRELADASALDGIDGLADLAEGKIARADGNVDAARQSVASAVEALGPAQMPFELAQARLELAHCQAATKKELALLDGEAALRAFESLGAERFADAAARLLRALGKKGRSVAVGRHELSKREREVLRLLGEGLTNPEIAERLYITRKTVEHHVGHVLSKLGLRNRAEAVAYALSRGEQLGEK
jgi:DNA-binding CsgD family transcriptional regulator